jgi:phospholipase C
MSPIEHFVVLALENRSFDHLVGSLRSQDTDIDGPIGTEFNYADPTTQTGKSLVTFDAPYVPDVDPDPGHEFLNVLDQLFLAKTVPSPIDPDRCNLGFAFDYRNVCMSNGQTEPVATSNAGNVLKCFGAQKLPALHTLAREFALCNKWFSSLPGPTWPNRFFMHCATSGGYLDNALRDYPMRTIFQNLSDARVNWRVYYHDVPQSLALANQRQYFWRYYELFDQAFARDCGNGLLPQYSFIEPRYSNEGASRANDQHPIHGVALGDSLIADVYEAMRSSPNWETSMLLITWDEHGGFYDHVLPPRTVNPDDTAPAAFDFTLLGVRVPAIIVSPYVPKGAVDNTVYDHSSICATIKGLFGLGEFLTRRDAQANRFDRLASLAEPRLDAPTVLPRIPNADQLAPVDGRATELHVGLTEMAESLVDPGAGAKPAPQTEQEAGRRIRAAMDQYRQTESRHG